MRPLCLDVPDEGGVDRTGGAYVRVADDSECRVLGADDKGARRMTRPATHRTAWRMNTFGFMGVTIPQ